MAYLNEIHFPRQAKDAGQVMECLRQMEDQVRFTLQNLDGDNIRAGAIGEDQLSGSVRQRIKTAEKSLKDVSELRQAVDEAAAALSDMNSRAVTRAPGGEAFRLYVGVDQPDGHGVLWFRPASVPGDGPRACEIIYIP